MVNPENKDQGQEDEPKVLTSEDLERFKVEHKVAGQMVEKTVKQLRAPRERGRAPHDTP